MLYAGAMHPHRTRDDFTLRIEVAEPAESLPALADDDGAPTRPFKKLSRREDPLALERSRARGKIAWARRLLTRFHFGF
jgi:hypothetical protein